jgi:3D (Asp-Asp-Asp) domain-containing protein
MKHLKKVLLFAVIPALFGFTIMMTPMAAQANGDVSKSKTTLDVVATAYAPGPHDNGQWGNKTYMGTQVRPGIIAVDPRIIPLGSRVRIEFPDGHSTYAVAEDTGGAIKGNRIDIAMWTVAEAYKFGIQNVKVSVLD